MAYFHAKGKFIENCGITILIADAGLLASGSLNGFISGKHFNRCKYLYPIIYLTFYMLHFEQFLIDQKTYLTDNELLNSNEVRDFLETLSTDKISSDTLDDEKVT